LDLSFDNRQFHCSTRNETDEIYHILAEQELRMSRLSTKLRELSVSLHDAARP
jgi:uncharacterized coiled-coil protein SlyX